MQPLLPTAEISCQNLEQSEETLVRKSQKEAQDRT